MNPAPPTLIAAAVPGELSVINDHMVSSEIRQIGHVQLKTGILQGRNVATLVTGPGPIHTAAALAVVLGSVSFNGLAVIGCAGGFEDSGLCAGDLALATQEVYPQLGIEDAKGSLLVGPLPFLPNVIELDGALIDKGAQVLTRAFEAENFLLHKGPFLTVSTVTSRAATVSLYKERYMAVAENMEGFSAALLSTRYKIPMIELRCISNLVGERDRRKWNLGLAFERAQTAAVKLLAEDIFQ